MMGLLEEQTNQQFTDLLDGSTIKKELLEAQNEQNHMAVCEVCPDFYSFSPLRGQILFNTQISWIRKD